MISNKNNNAFSLSILLLFSLSLSLRIYTLMHSLCRNEFISVWKHQQYIHNSILLSWYDSYTGGSGVYGNYYYYIIIFVVYRHVEYIHHHFSYNIKLINNISILMHKKEWFKQRSTSTRSK